MRKRKTLTVLVFSLFSIFLIAQETVTIEGYVYEAGNRGYLNLAKVTIIDPVTGSEKALLLTDKNGVFSCELPIGKEYELFVRKDLFKQYIQPLSTVGKTAGEKVFVKCLMEREPGYIFDVTIAEKRKEPDAPANAITGATIEVYNNSTDEQLLTLIDHPKQEFKCHFNDGNHYTVLIRKKGFFNKRMEAFVNVKGCILCFEGVGEVKPSDVLTEGNKMGTLLANVELEPIIMDEGIKIENIYYEYDNSDITDAAAFELDKLINVLRINPALVVELGSHTDSRGDDDYNFKLSSARAQSAMTYIIQNGDIERHRIRYQGYGETQIKNKCKNGVSCSDQAHAENRRTELKVVGLLDIDPYENKTLKDIIEEENFEKMLAELANQEQVKVTGDEVPDFIKEQEEQKKLAANKKELDGIDGVVEQVEEMAKVEEQVLEKMPEDLERVILEDGEVKIEEAEDVVENEEKAKVEELEKLSVETKAVTEIDATKTEEYKEGKASDNALEEAVVSTEDSDKVVPEVEKTKAPTPNKIPVKMTNASDDLKVYEEPSVKTPRPTPRPLVLPEGYTGYRVEFFNSPYELPPSHEIFFSAWTYNHGSNKVW